MKNLVLATTNPTKVERYGRFLSHFSNLNLLSLGDFSDLPKIDEPFDTAEKNAIHKAKKYHELLNENVLAVDEALYVDFLPQREQPGVHPRRVVDGVTAVSDEEILEYWLNKLKIREDLGGGYWLSAYVICPVGKEIMSCEHKSHFLFDIFDPAGYLPGYPMSGICKVELYNKVYAKMSETERCGYDKKILTPLTAIIEQFLS